MAKVLALRDNQFLSVCVFYTDRQNREEIRNSLMCKRENFGKNIYPDLGAY